MGLLARKLCLLLKLLLLPAQLLKLPEFPPWPAAGAAVPPRLLSLSFSRSFSFWASFLSTSLCTAETRVRSRER